MARKIGLFFLSLWLLFILMIIMTIDIPMCFGDSCEFVGITHLVSKNYISIISLISLIIGGVSYYDFVYRIKGSPEISFEITNIENVDYEHLTFLITYIVPLLTFDFSHIRSQIVFFFLLFAIGVIYIKTNLFYANPTLSILRFRVYKVNGKFVNSDVRQNIILITKEFLSKQDRVQYIILDEKIYFARKLKNGEKQ